MTIYQFLALIIFGIPGALALTQVSLAFRFREQPLTPFWPIVLAISTIALLVTFLGLRW